MPYSSTTLLTKNTKTNIPIRRTSHTIIGTASDMICSFKKDQFRYVCTSTIEKTEKLKYFILMILDHCIDQIHILCGGRSGSSQFAFFEDILKDRTEKSESVVFEPIYDKDTGDPFKEAFKRRQVNKLYSDSAALKELLTTIRSEIKDLNSSELFRKVIYEVKIKLNLAQELIKETEENQNKMKELKSLVVTQGRDCRLEIQKVNNVYAISCDSIQEIFFINLIRVRYAEAYENSRFEQNKIYCERELRELQNIISKYGNKLQKENRVFEEILCFININQKDLRDNIKIWIETYNTDMENKHFEIDKLKDNLEELQKYHIELKNLFEEHKQAIKEFKEYKDKKRIKEEEEERLAKAATKIQAWWRGMMYRHKLGPYNPHKKKGKNKKKNKKNKK